LIKKRILVVDDDDSLRWVTQAQLQQSGYDVAAAADGNSALASIRQAPPDLVITDLKMPGMSGLELLRKIREDYPEIIVIMVTAFGSVENAVEAMKTGAYDYIMKPVNMDELRLIVNRGLEHLDLQEEVRLLRSSLDQKYGFENILGRFENFALRAGHGLSGGTGHIDCPYPWRDRDRQGVVGQSDSFQQPAEGQAVRHHQLRRNSEGSS